MVSGMGIIRAATCHVLITGGYWVLRRNGFIYDVNAPDFQTLMDVWASITKFNIPGLHVSTSMEVVTMSTVTNELVRSIRIRVVDGNFVMQGPHVIFMAIYSCDALKTTGL